MLDAAIFERYFITWMQGLYPSIIDNVISIDGKTFRRSRSTTQKAIEQCFKNIINGKNKGQIIVEKRY